MLILGVAAGLGSLLFFRAAGTLTPTHDEYWHLPIGLAMWESGRFDQDRINPPLVRLWAAFPLYVSGVRLDVESAERESDYGDALLNSTQASACLDTSNVDGSRTGSERRKMASLTSPQSMLYRAWLFSLATAHGMACQFSRR